MKSAELRQKFLEFFQSNEHRIVKSSPVIPAQDPTILFANAGMNQFKDAFLGNEVRDYKRATTSQKCIRAGGKHNDLENVGFTERHLTFFEMLGNFSFGDYFKRDAIHFAWEFLTKVIEIPVDKLYATVYKDDQEAYDIWHKEIGLSADRISRLGEKDNFWQMGDTGPCGPCSEIFYDRGIEFQDAPGGKVGEDARYMEIWNNVFMQFNREANGELKPLKQTGVDTGMGLERLCVVMQNVQTVFDTDVFAVIHARTEKLTGKSYKNADTQTRAAFNVLADHIRSTSFIIADGASPSNEGRGYVLRKIIRRAALFAQKLSDNPHLFALLVPAVVESLGGVYPELKTNQDFITKILIAELDKFAVNLLQGTVIFEKYVGQLKEQRTTCVSGTQLFKLYDTYGFPPELTKVMAEERGYTIDFDGFEREMARQKEQSGKKAVSVQTIQLPEGFKTTFVGYEKLETDSPLLWCERDGDMAWIITQESPFYVESGGQINDSGTVVINGVSYELKDLKKIGSHFGDFAIAACVDLGAEAVKTGLPFAVGERARSIVDEAARESLAKNHTSTHLLQAVLIKLLGNQIKQAGSVVAPDYLRFDFSHHEALSAGQIALIEDELNRIIQKNISTEISQTSLADAQNKGVIAFFGEKYNPNNVRVVQVPGVSAELCGGTHVLSTGAIGAFKIVSEAALATGTRRIVAVTGAEALRLFQQSYQISKHLAESFKVKLDGVADAVEQLQEKYMHAQLQTRTIKKQLIKALVPSWLNAVKSVKNSRYLVLAVDDYEQDDFKVVLTELEQKEKLITLFINKSSANKERIQFLVAVSESLRAAHDTKKLLQLLVTTLGIKAGGAAGSLQGGCGAEQRDALINTLEQWISVS